jgi:hypothetical protein
VAESREDREDREDREELVLSPVSPVGRMQCKGARGAPLRLGRAFGHRPLRSFTSLAPPRPDVRGHPWDKARGRAGSGVVGDGRFDRILISASRGAWASGGGRPAGG